MWGKHTLRIKYDVFSFESFKSTKRCLSLNGLSLAIWTELLDPWAQIHKHDPNLEKKNENQKMRKHLNLLKNMKNTQMNLEM